MISTLPTATYSIPEEHYQYLMVIVKSKLVITTQSIVLETARRKNKDLKDNVFMSFPKWLQNLNFSLLCIM